VGRGSEECRQHNKTAQVLFAIGATYLRAQTLAELPIRVASQDATGDLRG